MSSMIVVVPSVFLLLWSVHVVNAQMDISNCGTMKGCLFAPSGCQPSSNCQIFFSYQVDGAYLNMELSGSTPTPDGYVAVGFSKDTLMGDDMVVFCANFGGQVTGGLARNDKKPSNTIISNIGIQNILQTSSVGGKLYCEISQRLDPNQSMLYNLNGSYNILLAMGPTDSNRLRYHQNNRYVMPRTSLSAFEKGIGLKPGAMRDMSNRSSYDKLMIAHGILMVLSWSIFISTAILFARHMKEHFPDHVYCGLKLWFHFHRTLNMIGIAGTIAGFVVVFVAKDWQWVGPKASQSAELNNQWGSVHAMLGLIACVVAWAQPLNAVFRCHPEHEQRFIFNWFHGFFGFGAWLCAASATMIAVVHFTRMFSSRDAALGLYIAFIVVAGLTTITMEVLTFQRWWMNRDRVTYEMEMVRVSRSESTTEGDNVMKIQVVQLFLLMFFIIVAIGTSVAISVLIGMK